MPSILDYFENPQFLNSVIGGGDGGGNPFDQPKAPVSSVIGQGWGGVDPQPSTPPPPPPQIMAQPPMGMNPGQFDNRFTGAGPEVPPNGPPPGPINGPVPMPQPNPFAPSPPPMPRPKPMDMTAPPPKSEGGALGGMGFGWDDMIIPGAAPTPNVPSPPGMGNPPPMIPEADPPAPGNAMALAPETKGGYPYVDPPGLNLRGGPIAATADPEGFARAKQNGVFGNQATPNRAGGELTIDRTPRNGTSLDDDQLARPTPVGNPMDIRSPAQSGQADPRIARAREFGTFLQGIGRGLSAPKRPGAGKGASFNAGAGGALLGIGEQENKNLDRDERGLDRGEKRRESDQTFDYRNRALQSQDSYHNKMIEQHSLDRGERTTRADADREERENRENWKPLGTQDGKPVFYNSKTRETVVGQEKLDQKIAAGGQGGSTERLADRLIADAKKEGKTLSLQDALAIVKRSPNGSAEELQRERLALQAHKDAKEDTKNRNKPEGTLDYWRQYYGLKVAPPPGPPPVRTMGSDAALSRPPLPGPGAPPVPASPPPVAAPQAAARQAAVPQWARQIKAPPGSHYSVSKNAIITPDGTVIPAPSGP